MASVPEWSIVESTEEGVERQVELVLNDASGALDWVKQVILGEFDENRDFSALLADMTLSLVPGVIIVTSARDLVAIITRLSKHPERRQDIKEWVLLFGTVVPLAYPIIAAGAGAAVAGVGAVVAGIGALATDGETAGIIRSICLLLLRGARSGEKMLSEIIHFLQSHVVGNIYAFLNKVRFAAYVKPICDAVQMIIARMLEMAVAAREVLIYTSPGYALLDYIEDIGAKLIRFEQQYNEVQQQLVTKITESAEWLQQKLDEILKIDPPSSGPMLATAGGHIGELGARASAQERLLPAWPTNPLGVPPEVAMALRAEEDALRGSSRQIIGEENVHGHEVRKPALEVMPEKKIPCFKADAYANNPWLSKEFDRQLKQQNEGLNELTVEQYAKNRGQYLNPMTRQQLERDRGKVARQARGKYKSKVALELREKFVKEGSSLKDAKELAKQQAEDKMKGLAALHEPDLVAGGYNIIQSVGSRRINSSLGSQWVKKPDGATMTRVQIIDEYIKTVPKEKWATTQMNMKLERCKP